MTDVLVIGAGAAGIMAAWRAASLGARVVLLEKTERIGAKILISGGGKCNICHDGPIEDVFRAFRANEARFLRPAVYRWPNHRIIDLFTSRGLEVYTRPDGRVFPVHQSAKDVVAILREYLTASGVDLRLNSPVTELICESGVVTGVKTSSGQIDASRVIVSVGGSSYPKTGSTGDGWRWAKALGHTIIPIRAALAPLYLEAAPHWADTLSGVALRDVELIAKQAGKTIDRWRGDVLFTHHGLSGPCALAVSRVIAERLPSGSVEVGVNLYPDESPETTQARLTSLCHERVRKSVSALIDDAGPQSIGPWLLKSAGLDPTTPIAQLEKRARNRLAETLRFWNLGAVRAVPLERGECVAGGVSLDEVDPHSMRSNLIENLWICGEALDIAGPVGGYNLQAAFATGYVAGETAAQSLSSSVGK